MALTKKTKPQASQLYQAYFSTDSLLSLYHDKISLSNSVGRDGVRKGLFEEKLGDEIELIIKKVDQKKYQFTGYKEQLISKGANKNPRQISIPTYRDRLVLRATCQIVTDVFDNALMRPPHEYIKEIKNIAQRYGDDYCFLRMDIREYYPSINQDFLLKKIRKKIKKTEVLDLIEKAIKTPTGRRNTLSNRAQQGVPQGLSISNILSSVYLIDLDEKYANKSHFHYFRYVDDILVICPKSLSTKIYKKIHKDLTNLNLESHPLKEGEFGKTQITSMSQGVEYLGFKVTNTDISVRPSSYKKMFTNLLKVFTNYKYSKNTERFIFRLNLKIAGCIFEGKRRGWMFFFAQSEDISQLKYLDEFVADLLKKHKLDHLSDQIKTFTKAYHEIRYRVGQTQYIENFDKCSQDRKTKIISILTGKTVVEIKTWDADRIEENFRKCSFKEVAQLQKDLIDAFS